MHRAKSMMVNDNIYLNIKSEEFEIKNKQMQFTHFISTDLI